jgi:hypothetical protein
LPIGQNLGNCNGQKVTQLPGKGEKFQQIYPAEKEKDKKS